MFFKDFFMIEPSSNTTTGQSSDPDIRQTAANCRGLKVILSASHAGKLTKNSTLYPPTTFQKCSHTFVSPYQKAVQTHHDDKSDPIGRIIGARYIPYLAGDFADDYRDVFIRFQDKLTKSTILDSVRFLEETGVIFDRDWRGLGELELETLITDQSAIEKILDGRYNTVSVGMEPHQVYCSICNKDWLKDREPCEHQKGKVDEDSERLMYLISGDITGMEVSYINHPADDLAFNKNFDVVPVGQETNNENQYQVVDSYDKRNVTYELLDGVSYDTVSLENKEEEKGEVLEDIDNSGGNMETMTLETSIATVIEDEQSVTDEMSLLINLAIEDKVLTAAERKRLKSKTFCGPSRSYPADTRARAISALARVKQFGSPSLQKRVKSCVCKKYPGLPACSRRNDENLDWTPEIIKELDTIIKHPITGADTTLGQYIFGIEDALTEKDLNKLSDNVFYGPNRSFHILSEDHYNAAIELLDSYQGEGDITAMTEKLEESKKALEDNIEEEVVEEEVVKDEEEIEEKVEEQASDNSCLLDGLDDVEIVKLSLDIERMLVDRKLRAPRQCFECESRDEEKKVLEDKVKELETTAEVLRKEIKLVNSDCVAADNALVELNKEIEDLYRQSVSNLTLLVDKDTNQEEFETSLSEMPLDLLKDSFSKLQDQTKEIIELNKKGLTQEVSEEEEVTIEDAQEVEEEEVKITDSYSDTEIAYFKKLKKFNDNRPQFAQTHLRELQIANKINKDLTLDQICDIVERI